MKTIVLTLMSIFWMCSLLAQTPEFVIYNTSNSQIPWNKFKAMDFDKNGHLWGGYDNSGSVPHLTRFDGSAFTNYINNAWVNDVVADASGDIWFTTSNMELQKYDGSFHIYTDALMSSPWMEPLFADLSGNLWVVNNSSKYIARFNGSSWLRLDYTNSCLPNSSIRDFADHKNFIWMAASDSGLVKFGNTECMLYHTGNSPLPDNHVFALKAGKGDTLWFVCTGNLGYFTGSDWFFYPNTSLTSAVSLQIDSKGNIWIANPNFTSGGVFRFDRQNWTVYNKDNSPIPTNQILDMKVDSNDRIWVATWGSGLVKMTPYPASVREIDHKVQCYPDPVRDKLTIVLPEAGNYEVDILSLTGQVWMRQPFGQSYSCTFDIGFLPPQVYLVRIWGEKRNMIKKIVKVE